MTARRRWKDRLATTWLVVSVAVALVIGGVEIIGLLAEKPLREAYQIRSKQARTQATRAVTAASSSEYFRPTKTSYSVPSRRTSA